MKRKAKIYCCCNKAKEDCEDRCRKGRMIKPDHVVYIKDWPKRFSR